MEKRATPAWRRGSRVGAALHGLYRGHDLGEIALAEHVDGTAVAEVRIESFEPLSDGRRFEIPGKQLDDGVETDQPIGGLRARLSEALSPTPNLRAIDPDRLGK
jgi:hypothetical protein